jgi:hypothetical protein
MSTPGRETPRCGQSPRTVPTHAGRGGQPFGKPVKYVPVSVAAVVDCLAKMGVSDYVEVSFRDCLTAYSQGWQSEVTDPVKRITGKAPPCPLGHSSLGPTRDRERLELTGDAHRGPDHQHAGQLRIQLR